MRFFYQKTTKEKDVIKLGSYLGLIKFRIGRLCLVQDIFEGEVTLDTFNII